jgi:UDP-N-acetylmuramoyl-tripeptide--D-alanyl-D-alanine ligase
MIMSSNIFSKIKFVFKKNKVVVVTGSARKNTFNAIRQLLHLRFKIGRDILVFQTEDKRISEYDFFLRNSKEPILVATNLADIPSNSDFFAGERGLIKNTRNIVKTLPKNVNLVLNFDDETSREIGDSTELKILTFGLQNNADLKASDFNVNGGTNFKINYKGNTVPVWLEKTFGKEQIYSVLAAGCVGSILGLNLIESSEVFKDYDPLPGNMNLVRGVKNSWILDDTESASAFSMIEAIEILGKLKKYNRKIAVLGDIVGIGKYTIEAHEAIGEKIVKNADLLFVFGQRAKFIAQGAMQKGMSQENIFEFDTIDEGKIELQDTIKENDIVLVDGSTEMQMNKIVKEIRM